MSILLVPFDAHEALATIDLALATCSGRELISTDELSDLLLDLRQLMAGGE